MQPREDGLRWLDCHRGYGSAEPRTHSHMSKHRIKIIAVLGAIACCLGANTGNAKPDNPKSKHGRDNPPAASAGLPSSAASTSGENPVRLAGREGGKTMKDFVGQKIQGADRQELGTIKDFMIDTKTGKIAYAVVASGGHETLRLVQQSSLRPNANGEGFTAQLDKASFDALETIDQQRLDSDRVARISPQSQQISDATTAGTTPPPPPIGSTPAPVVTAQSASAGTTDGTVASATTPPVEVTAAPSTSSQKSGETPDVTHLSRATTLTGKTVKAGNEELGRIEQLAFDLSQGTAMAVLEAKGESGGGAATFHVPLSALQFPPEDGETVTTTLTRAALSQAQAGGATAATTSSRTGAATDEVLTPTGRPSANSATGASAVSTSSGATEGRSITATGVDIDRSRSGPGIDASAPVSAPAEGGKAKTETPTPPRSTAGNIDRTSPAATTEGSLPPTGRGEGNPHAQTGAAASAIRAALEKDPALSGNAIEVKEAGRKVMLRGTVATEQLKDQVESVAKTAAAGAEIDNKIKVDRK